jgi:hypothetical protein
MKHFLMKEGEKKEEKRPFEKFVICLFVHHLHPITTSSNDDKYKMCFCHQTPVPF